MIVDLGVLASMECATWVETMKHRLADQEIILNNCLFIFCGSPDPDIVNKYFDIILSNKYSYRLIFIVFSDDGILGVQINGKWRTFNTDISTCDASHTGELFNLIFKMFNAPDTVVKDYLNQFMSVVRVNAVEEKRVYMIKPLEPYLQSGSTITTLCNTIAQYCMFCKWATSDIQSTEQIIDGAGQVGYVITMEENHIPEDLQFLKMSPCLSKEGRYEACLNLGVILRASGTCRGDLPKVGKKRDFHIDAAKFQNNIISGCMARIDHYALRNLAPYGIERNLDTLKSASMQINALRHITAGRVVEYDDQIYNRYRLSTAEIAELNELIMNSTFGSCVYSTAVAKILEKDYGLTCPLKA